MKNFWMNKKKIIRKSFAFKERKIPSTFFLLGAWKRKAWDVKNKILKKCILKYTLNYTAYFCFLVEEGWWG